MNPSVVIDNSIVMRWFHPSGSQADLVHADKILEGLETGEIVPIAPVILTMEFPNVLHQLKRQGDLNGQIETAIMDWESLNFTIMGFEYNATLYMRELNKLCSKYSLSAYDAAYLELAIRLQCPLATLDKKLKKAAKTSENFFFEN